MTSPRPGTLVEGTSPATGKRFVGWLRGEHPHHRTNGLWVVDNPRWRDDQDRTPAHQRLVVDIRPVEGQELEDTVYQDYAKKVLDGATSKAEAVAEIARQLKIGKAKAEPKLDAAIAAEKAERRAHTPKTRAPKAASGPAKAAGKGEHAPPKMFEELRDSLGLTNKEAAAAQAAAGLGSTLSRITELTHSKGASMAMFERVKEAWTAWREANPAPVQDEE